MHLNVNIRTFTLIIEQFNLPVKVYWQQQNSKLSQLFPQITHNKTVAVISTQINSAYEQIPLQSDTFFDSV